jgi:hypothetical protein
MFYVDLDRAFADVQGLSDLLVGLAGGKEGKDLGLAWRKRLDRWLVVLYRAGFRLVLSLIGQAPEEQRGQFLVQGRLAVECSADRANKAGYGASLSTYPAAPASSASRR